MIDLTDEDDAIIMAQIARNPYLALNTAKTLHADELIMDMMTEYSQDNCTPQEQLQFVDLVFIARHT